MQMFSNCIEITEEASPLYVSLVPQLFAVVGVMSIEYVFNRMARQQMSPRSFVSESNNVVMPSDDNKESRHLGATLLFILPREAKNKNYQNIPVVSW